MSEQSLDQKLAVLEKLTATYEKLARLTEQELSNAYEMIKMYETILDFTRKELIAARETAAARENVSSLSDAELKNSYDKIKDLEKANIKLREERTKLT